MVEMLEPILAIQPPFISQILSQAFILKPFHQRLPVLKQGKQNRAIPTGEDAEGIIPMQTALPFRHYTIVKIAH
jgi:hypothetical protein